MLEYTKKYRNVTFEEQLALQGIYPPSKYIFNCNFIPKPRWLGKKEQSAFEQAWAAAKEEYRLWTFYMSLQEWRPAKLVDDEAMKKFGVHIYENEIPEMPQFKTPEEAYEKLKAAKEEFVSPWQQLQNLYAEWRKSWFFDTVLANAPVGAKLIVLKNKYYEPYTEHKERFKQDVKEGNAVQISRNMGLTPEWISIATSDTDNLDFIHWGINPDNAIVEYL